MLRENLSKKAIPKKEYFHFETEDGVSKLSLQMSYEINFIKLPINSELLGQIHFPPRLNKDHVTQYPVLIHT